MTAKRAVTTNLRSATRSKEHVAMEYDMSNLILGVKQAGELQDAFRRDLRWTPELVKRLSQGDLLSQVVDVLIGISEIHRLTSRFAHDKTREGWTLVEDVGFEPQLTASTVLEVVPAHRLHVVRGPGFYTLENQHQTGWEYFRQTPPTKPVLGQMHAEWLMKHVASMLQPIHDCDLLFPGTRWRDSKGDVCIPHLTRYSGAWELRFYSLGAQFGPRVYQPRLRE